MSSITACDRCGTILSPMPPHCVPRLEMDLQSSSRSLGSMLGRSPEPIAGYEDARAIRADLCDPCGVKAYELVRSFVVNVTEILTKPLDESYRRPA